MARALTFKDWENMKKSHYAVLSRRSNKSFELDKLAETIAPLYTAFFAKIRGLTDSVMVYRESNHPQARTLGIVKLTQLTGAETFVELRAYDVPLFSTVYSNLLRNGWHTRERRVL